MIVLSMVLICFSAQAGVQTDKIQSLISDGKLREALNLTDKHLQEDEGSVTFRFLKGLILTRLNELNKARDIFVALTREHPDLPEPYNNLAVIYASQGDFEKARDALQLAISTHPSYATAHENMGDIYAKMASKAYNQALQLDADNSSAKAKLSLVNDLFFVPKRENAEVETVAEIATPPEPELVQQVVTEPALVAVEMPEEVVPDLEQRKMIAEQIAAKKLIEDKKREQEKLKSTVASTIDQWAKVWSAKNAEKYVMFYGKDFIPPQQMSRAAWEDQRRVRLAKPRYIKIKLSNVEITLLGDDHAQVALRQSYESDTYRDEVNKELLLKKVSGEWLITQEQSK
ncbi:MAG: hypothetical protein ACI9SC_000442 [Gammaproteobacteria bacterium]|jgi:hypothetical protein